jgi:hypothetical protein
MKKFISALTLVGAIVATMPVHAHGFGRGGYGWHGGYWGGGWGVPLIAGAVIGAGIYANTAPYYYSGTTVYYNQPATVYSAVPPVGSAPPAPRIGYFCATTNQFYPNVPNCQTPWQQVTLP